jgi:hypothetical protein
MEREESRSNNDEKPQVVLTALRAIAPSALSERAGGGRSLLRSGRISLSNQQPCPFR